MSKRRAESPADNSPVAKKLSWSTLTPDRENKATFKIVDNSDESPPKPKPRGPLREFGPWQKASTTNLRAVKARPRRNRESLASPQAPRVQAPLKPGLHLSGQQLETPKGEDIAQIKSVLLFPTTLAVIKPSWPFCFDVNCTPQLGPPLPQSIAEDLYSKYVCSSPLLRPGKLPYMHIGSTTLGFRLHFYLILPNTGGPPSGENTGHLTDETLQRLFDSCICPAIEATDPTRKQGMGSWMQAMNASNLKRQNPFGSPEPQEERIHCIHLSALWERIVSCEEDDMDEGVRDLLDGFVLVAYGDVEQEGWRRPSWAAWKRDWEGCVEGRYLKGESRISVGLELGVGVEVEGAGKRGLSRYERNQREMGR